MDNKKNLKEIITTIRAKENDLINIGVNKIIIFGSFVTGKETEQSDIDILFSLKNETKLGILKIIKSIDEIKDVLKDLHNLDIHHHRTVKKTIYKEIIMNGIQVF